MIAEALAEALFARVRGDGERTRALRIALERFDDVEYWVRGEGLDEAVCCVVAGSRALLRAFDDAEPGKPVTESSPRPGAAR